MIVRFLRRALQDERDRLPDTKPDPEVIVSVSDREGQWQFDARITGVHLDTMSGTDYIVINAQQED